MLNIRSVVFIAIVVVHDIPVFKFLFLVIFLVGTGCQLARLRTLQFILNPRASFS